MISKLAQLDDFFMYFQMLVLREQRKLHKKKLKDNFVAFKKN